MPAALLDGNAVASIRYPLLKKQVDDYVRKGNRAPALAVVLVGQDPASHIYVQNKRSSCSKVGMTSYSYDLPEQTTQEELLALIDELNAASQIDGILIQLPLPAHINSDKILERIKAEKDVDGFHPYSLGRLAQKNPLLRPCTPLGIIHLLEHYQIEIKGKHAVVIGASNIVGCPMALEFLLKSATVTVCHRYTRDLERFVNMADLIVVATGKMNVIDVNWLQKDQVLVDVGIHRLPNGSLQGDVDFHKAREKVQWITPVPGGVGPMTIITLLENTLLAATKQNL